ncbi:hypothetical protein ACJQWK_11957 [Exserohilum turcicum]
MARRRPPNPDFDYNTTPKKEDDFFDGFQIIDSDTRLELKARCKKAFLQINPDLVAYYGTDKAALHKKHVQQMYQASPELCESPEPWKRLAITWWMTQARTSVHRSRPNTEHGKRKRSVSLSDDETRISPQKRTRRRQPENEYEGDASVVESIEPFNSDTVKRMQSLSLQPSPSPQVPRRAKPFCGPTQIRFAALSSNGVITDDDIIAEIEMEEILTDSTVSREKPSAITTSLGDCNGFFFISKLYLSPRSNQRFAITHPALLRTAMRDFFPGSKVTCTTSPIPKACQSAPAISRQQDLSQDESQEERMSFPDNRMEGLCQSSTLDSSHQRRSPSSTWVV